MLTIKFKKRKNFFEGKKQKHKCTTMCEKRNNGLNREWWLYGVLLGWEITLLPSMIIVQVHGYGFRLRQDIRHPKGRV